MPDLKLYSISNFRVIGNQVTSSGKKVRPNRIYRSGSLDTISSRDRSILCSLGLKTIIDLRSETEYSNKPLQLNGIRKVGMPISTDINLRERLKPFMFKNSQEEKIKNIITDIYLEMVDKFIPHLKGLSEILASEESYPLLIHCRAGRDRTGFACALIQTILKVDFQLIIDDYLDSNKAILPDALKKISFLKKLTLGLLPTDNLITAITIRESYLRAAFQKIEQQHGGIQEYLRAGGVSNDQIRAITAKLLIDG